MPEPFHALPTHVALPPHLLRSRLSGLYVITDARLGGGHLAMADAALSGGVKIIQLRDKITPLRQLLPIALELRRRTHGRALFIVNDRLDLALAAGADGVHLGPGDLPVASARKIAGPHFLIGASCGNAAEACDATVAGADYIGAGDIFGTTSKLDAGPPIGLAGLAAIAGATALPVAAIGGLGRDNIRLAIEAGAAMACVISALASRPDESPSHIAQAARKLIELAGFTSGCQQP